MLLNIGYKFLPGPLLPHKPIRGLFDVIVFYQNALVVFAT